MEKTFIVGKTDILKSISENFIELPNLESETEIHNWVIHLFENSFIDKIIIAIEENPVLSLQIGYHIRLSFEKLHEKSLIPILYVSTLQLNTVMSKAGIYSNILSSNGVYFTELDDIEIVKAEVDLVEGLSENEYLTQFLKIIHIQPDETIGRHSLANIWGAHAMDIAANTNALPEDANYKKKLYFKYISAFNNLDKLKPSLLKIKGKIRIGNANVIDAKNKRILLIDDEADKGWVTVLKKVLKVSGSDDFVVINEKVADFKSFTPKSKEIIEKNNFDLYLVDLRLNGLEEEDNLDPDNFSGMKVLKQIKSLNQGNQVVIFTASNKVWNLKALLDAGADGYYMKESPEYNFTKTISEQNFKDFKSVAEKCFEKSYLKEIYTSWNLAKEANNNPDAHFLNESDSLLDIAWNLIKQEQLDFGYLTLFQAIEVYANASYQINEYNDTLEGKTTINKSKSENNEWLLTFVEDPRDGSYFVTQPETKSKETRPQTLYKVSCLLHIKYGKDNTFLKRIGSLNKIRNKIAHHGSQGKTSKSNITELLKVLELLRHN